MMWGRLNARVLPPYTRPGPLGTSLGSTQPMPADGITTMCGGVHYFFGLSVNLYFPCLYGAT